LQIKSLPTDVNIRNHYPRPYRVRTNHLAELPMGFPGDFLGVFTPVLSLRISSFIESISLTLVRYMTFLPSIKSEADVEDDRVSVGIGSLTANIGTAPSADSTSFLSLDAGDWRCFDFPAGLH
jgi:hypothetical protein